MTPLLIGRGICGIYKITNLVNGSVYVGCSKDVRKRWIHHRCMRLRDHHMSICKAFRKYGIDNFVFELIEECPVDLLSEREMFWIETLRPRYNRTKGGRGANGYNQSPEARAVLAVKAREQWQRMTPEERAERVRNNLCGPKPGHRVSMETRRKLSDYMRGRNLGVKFTELRKQKIRDGIRKADGVRGVGHWKPVVNVNAKGRAVCFYSSVKFAAEDMGVHPSVINAVLKGRRKTSRGYRWFYTNVDALGPINRPSYYEQTKNYE